MQAFLSTVASLVLMLILWQALVMLTGLQHFILPSPLLVIKNLWYSRVLLIEHAVITIIEVLLGLVFGTMLGGLSAIGLAYSSIARLLIKPILVFSQAIPVFALAPMLTLWLGYGIASKIVMSLIIIYFPVTLSFFDALMRTRIDWIEMAWIMGGNPWRIMWQIRIPAALPGLASGLRLASVYAPIGAVIGEWVGASQGLGYLMLLANGRIQTDLMFAALIILAIFTVAFHAIINVAVCKYLEIEEKYTHQ